MGSGGSWLGHVPMEIHTGDCCRRRELSPREVAFGKQLRECPETQGSVSRGREGQLATVVASVVATVVAR